MCTCNHGRDRHFIDYAYGVGCWWGNCTEEGCDCKQFSPVVAAGTVIWGSNGPGIVT